MSSSLLRPRSPTSELVDARDRPSQPSAEPSAAAAQRLNDAMVRTMDFLNSTDQLALLSADAELAEAVAVLVALAFANLVRASETVEDGGFKCVRRVFWSFTNQEPHAWESASAKMLSNLAEFDVVLKEAIAATLRHVLVEAMGDISEVYVLLKQGDPFIGWIANVFGFQFPATASWNSPVPSPEPCCGLVRIDDSRSVRFLRLAYSYSRISDDDACREVQCSPAPSVYAACQHGHTDCFRVLRHLGARDDEFMVNHVNAFSFVASTGNEDFCRFLLARGASLQYRKGTCLALSAAVASGHEHIVRFLISAGAKATNAHLGTAVSRSDEAESMIRLLIEDGADVNGRLDGRFWHGATPLHLASGALRGVNTQLLVSLGASVNARDLNGATPLIRALQASNHYDSVDAFQKRCAAFELRRRNVVVCLCTAGADATLSDRQGESAVSLAAGANMEELLRYFHSIGVDVTAAGGNGITPFFIAASKGYVSLAQFLHGCGADVNGTSRDGTPLVAAVTNGHDAMVKYLHSVGADFTKHAPGSSLLQIATRHKHAKIASFIKKVTKKKEATLTPAFSGVWPF